MRSGNFVARYVFPGVALGCAGFAVIHLAVTSSDWVTWLFAAGWCGLVGAYMVA